MADVNMTDMAVQTRSIVLGTVAVLVIAALAAVLLPLPCLDCPPNLDEVGEPSGTVSEPSLSTQQLSTSDANPDANSEEEEAGLEVAFNDLSTVQAGDSISLTIPQESRSLQANVENIERSTAGNRIITGQLVDPLQPDTTYPFVFTIGQKFTFGTIQTSLDRYQMQAEDGVGSMIAASALLKDIDYSKPDFVLPEHTKVGVEEIQE